MMATSTNIANRRNIKNSKDLKAAISELEQRIHNDQYGIKENFEQVKENLNPKRVVKNTFSYVAETPEIQRTLVNTVLGMILGYASKKAVELLSEQSLDRTVTNLVNHHISKLESRDPNSLLSKGISLFRKYTPVDSPIYPLIKS